LERCEFWRDLSEKNMPMSWMRLRLEGDMKRSIRVIVFLIVICAVLGFAVQEPIRDLINGQEWGRLSKETKVGYMMGFEEGLMIAQTAVKIEKKEIGKGAVEFALLDRIEKWIEVYKVGGLHLESKVKTADDVFAKDPYKSIMVAAVLPLAAKRVRGEINEKELIEKLEQLRDVLINE